MLFSFTYFFLPKKKSKRCERKPPIISNLKYKIWAHRPSIKGTKPLFIVIKAIILIIYPMWNYLSWSERRTVGPEVANSIPAKTPKIKNSKFTFEHVKLRAKLLDYYDFVRSNKSNINQFHIHLHMLQKRFTHTSTVRGQQECNFTILGWSRHDCFVLSFVTTPEMSVLLKRPDAAIYIYIHLRIY